jgi:hypothetical protein
MKITFIDSGVLVTAARGVGEDSEKALEILADSKPRICFERIYQNGGNT